MLRRIASAALQCDLLHDHAGSGKQTIVPLPIPLVMKEFCSIADISPRSIFARIYGSPVFIIDDAYNSS
eukprot:74516-Amphidinium_carterae.1